jgi:alkanesulfonate monooxygenase SsuD/methylene tetrahydromethanopterin reductase-like flavin-dependent oxidoreductase (luciferase family)
MTAPTMADSKVTRVGQHAFLAATTRNSPNALSLLYEIRISLPQIGTLASADRIRAVAQHAEKIGYDSLWVLERTLKPVQPLVPYPATPDGQLPEEYKIVFDPIESLTFAAAVTSRIKLAQVSSF